MVCRFALLDLQLSLSLVDMLREHLPRSFSSFDVFGLIPKLLPLLLLYHYYFIYRWTGFSSIIRSRAGSGTNTGASSSQGSTTMHRNLDLDRGRGGGGNRGICGAAQRHAPTFFALVAVILVLATVLTRHDADRGGLGSSMGIRFNADNPLGK